jgi:hypothetical protein
MTSARRAGSVANAPYSFSGTLQGTFKRQNTGKWEWTEARFVADTWETAAWWTTQPGPTPAPQAPAPDARVTVADATEAFLAKSRNRGIAEPTFKKYQTFVKHLRIYCDQRGYICLDRLTVTDTDRFYDPTLLDGYTISARVITDIAIFCQAFAAASIANFAEGDNWESPDRYRYPACVSPTPAITVRVSPKPVSGHIPGDEDGFTAFVLGGGLYVDRDRIGGVGQVERLSIRGWQTECPGDEDRQQSIPAGPLLDEKHESDLQVRNLGRALESASGRLS